MKKKNHKYSKRNNRKLKETNVIMYLVALINNGLKFHRIMNKNYTQIIIREENSSVQ